MFASLRFPLSIVAALLFIPAAAPAEDLEADSNDWTMVFPELKNTPTPQWVKPGLQLHYYFATAMVAGARHGYTPDEKGDWKDDKGNRYSQYDVNGTGAHGYAVTTILAVEKNVVVAQMGSSLFSPNGPLAPSLVNGLLANGGANDGWMSAAAMEKLRASSNQVMKVTPGPFVLDNKKYDALWVVLTTDKMRSYYVYDTASGILLRSGSSAEGAAPAVVGKNEPAGPMTTLTLTSYVGSRTLKLPWGGENLPDAVAKLRQLAYQGTMTVTVPGAGAASYPNALTVDLKRRGDSWIETFINVPAQGGFPTPPVRVFNATWGTGGLFLPPAALARLKAGQVLDTDPVTKYVTSVVGQVPGPNGGRAVVIREKGQIHSLDCVYDLTSGLLIGLEKNDGTTAPGYTQTKLQLSGQR